MEKKGSKISKKGFRKGFLNNGISKPKPPPSVPASSAYISELQRLLRIRNECVKIRVNTHGFISDREREAFLTFHDLIDNAAPDVLADPNLIKLIQQSDRELEDEMGFNNWFPIGKASSSASSASYGARKRHHIAELKRLLKIRNEYMKIRKSTNRVDENGFVDEREREYFTAFNALFHNAEPGLICDPDVMKVMEESELELADEVFGVEGEDLSSRVYSAKEEFIKGLTVGEEVRIVGGRDIGKKGKILEVRDEDDIVVLRFLNGEETVVWVGNVANLGSVAEDMCLVKLIDPNGKGKETEDMRLMEMVKNLKIMGKGQFSRNKYY